MQPVASNERKTRAVKPTVGWLTVNRECNMRCGWCYAKGTGYKKSDEMSLDLATELLDTMSASGVNKVILIGGEPTLWSSLFDCNEYAQSLGLSTTLVTNATRFSIDSFWERYSANPCSHTSISIKAYDEDSYRCVTGRSNFEQTKSGIRRALSLTTSANASVVFTGEDMEEMTNLARFARECGARGLTISPSTPPYVGGKAEIGTVTHPQKFVDSFVAIYDELDRIFEGRMSLSVKLPLCIWPREFILAMIAKGQLYSTCQLQHRSGLLFDTVGNLISCNSIADYTIGSWGKNFSNAETLATHLEGEAVGKFYDQMNRYASSKCITCSMKHKCGGGCPLFYGAFAGDDIIRGWDEPIKVPAMA